MWRAIRTFDLFFAGLFQNALVKVYAWCELHVCGRNRDFTSQKKVSRCFLNQQHNKAFNLTSPALRGG
jgi:hypothetical protein